MVYDVDIIVVGSGGAGHAAAISASEHGARVLVLDAADRIGGSTAMSGGVIYAAGTSVQREAGIDDSPDALFEHYMSFTQWLLRPALVRRYCDEAPAAIDWLIEQGVVFDPESLYRAGVEDGRRGHIVSGNGPRYIEVVHDHALRRGVKFELGMRVDRLLTDSDGRVTGVQVGEQQLASGAVVLACGGLGANSELLARYYPDAAQHGDWHHYIGAPTNQGDGLTLAVAVGAAVDHSSFNQGVLLRAPHFDNREIEAFMPPWLMFVNEQGRRFCDETAPYAVMDGIINAQTGKRCFAVFDEAMFLGADGDGGEAARFLADARTPNWEHRMLAEQLARGRVARGDSLAELAVTIGVHPGALVTNVERYNCFVAQGHDEEFFKGMAGTVPIQRPPYYATELRAATMVNSSVGVVVDVHGQVRSQSDRPIGGLYAVGETAGGIVGKYLGGGNSLGSGVIFGRVAGRHAAEHLVGTAVAS